MSVIANIKITQMFIAFFFVICVVVYSTANAQNKSEQTIVPFEELLQRPVKIKTELQGKHPRVFFTDGELEKLRVRAKTTDKELWSETIKDIRGLKENPPKPGSAMLDRSGVEQIEGDVSQYDVALVIAETSFIYAIEKDPRLLEAAKRWLFAAIKYDPWGYTFRTPNVDLPPAYLLYAVAFAYDTLYNDLSVSEREAVRTKLTKQARLMYDYFKYKPKKKYTYSQNHTFIPMSGLAIAAYALMGEETEAEDWAKLSRAIFDRVLMTFGTDGYFYEGFHYFNFSFRWIIHYLDAHEHITGEDLYAGMRERFVPLKFYMAHSVLPDGKNVFDFGDTGNGAKDRNSKKQQSLQAEYDAIYRLAAKYKDADAQGIADWLRRDLKAKSREKIWAFISHDDTLKANPISAIPASYYFREADTVFWRSGWDKNATAFAFRCGPPAGHDITSLLMKIPDWRLNTGHSHPDANSFIIYAKGRYLTGDTGYAGIKQTSDHNTILIDERGQENDGRHEMFKEVPYQRLDNIRIAEVWGTPDYFYVRGEAAAAYFTDLNVKRFDRNFLYVAPDYFVVWDEISTKEPRLFSWLLNADDEIKNQEENSFYLINKDAALRVVKLLPENAKSEILPQMILDRGRPGSVEKGKEEQRGFQLVTRSVDKKKDFEFLHFLMPISLQSNSAIPKVSLLDEKDVRGLQVFWANGDKEFVLLKGKSQQIKSDAVRAVLRIASSGDWSKIILQNGTSLINNGQTVFKSEKPVSVSVNSNENKLNGWISTAASTTITLSVQKRPQTIRVNGQTAKFDYDIKTRSIAINIGTGKSKIESE